LCSGGQGFSTPPCERRFSLTKIHEVVIPPSGSIFLTTSTFLLNREEGISTDYINKLKEQYLKQKKENKAETQKLKNIL
jgi:hypothetical protein